MITVRQAENATVERPEVHRLDELLGRQLVAAMREHIRAGAYIVLNLEDVQYLNSEALGYITTCARRLMHHHGGLAVCCLQDGPRGVFRITRMERVLSGIFDTEEEALEALATPPRR